MNEKKIKVLGIVVAILGFGIAQLSEWIATKSLDAKIDERIVVIMSKQK